MIDFWVVFDVLQISVQIVVEVEDFVFVLENFIEVVPGVLVDIFLFVLDFKRVVPGLLVDIFLFVLENFIPVVPELFVTIDKVVSMYFVVDFSVVSKLVVVLKPFRSSTYKTNIWV